MFTKEKVNTGRQLELDIARGLAVLFMIFIHSQIFFANNEVSNSMFGIFNDFVGMVPSAPMFMFLLGVGINYSRKQDGTLMIKRGLKLILTGYLLNLLKGFIPALLKTYLSSDITYFYEGIAELMYIDIFHFSGLALIMFGIFTQLRLGNISIMIFSTILALINVFLVNIKIDNFWLSSFTGLFWGSSEYSYFPFSTWFFYPIMGYFFGYALIRCLDKKKFYLYAFIVSLVVFFGGTYLLNFILSIPNGMLNENHYYHHILTDNITFTALVVLEITTLSFIISIVPNPLESTFKRWSKNVSSIFFIHWIIITWSALIIPMNSLNMIFFVMYLVVLVPISDYLAYLDSKRKSFSIASFMNVKQ